MVVSATDRLVPPPVCPACEASVCGGPAGSTGGDRIDSLGVRFYDSVYNPVTVLWLFLSQVIHANPTLAVTVECFLAWRLAEGLSPCSTDTGAYTRARQRLPEALLAMLTRHTGCEAERAALSQWRWLGRAVKVFDGSTVSMPDTPENQEAFPQSRTQTPGVGFPLARIGVLFSLSVGTVLDLGIRRWAGKFQSELAMLRDMIPSLQAGEVLLTDCYLCSYMEIDLRSLKTMMNMDVLRCQTPAMVRKEIWAHLLAYNLIRTVIAQAAARHGKHPRQIGFTRAMRTLEAFRSAIACVSNDQLAELYEDMLNAIASHEIGNRPDRLEPRQRKRRPKPYK